MNILLGLILIRFLSADDDEHGTTTTEYPTFSVQRLDSPLERIEIRLIDEINKTESSEEVEQESTSARLNIDSSSTVKYSKSEKTEYDIQKDSKPVIVGEVLNYFPTRKTTDEEIQAKAWISISPTTIPQFEGDIDDEDLPPPPEQSSAADKDDPEEECLANKEKLSHEIIERLKQETATYYKLILQKNEQQKQNCKTTQLDAEMYRRCSDWRAEKLVYYYKLMRKTYCQVENWPNPSKAKQTYGEYLNLFGTFYAFQK